MSHRDGCVWKGAPARYQTALFLAAFTFVAATVAQHRSVVVSGQTPGRSVCADQAWFSERGYTPEQRASLCAGGIDFVQRAATITFRSGLDNRFASELLKLPISIPSNGQFIVAAAAYCGFSPQGNSAQGLVLLSHGGISAGQQLTPQDCTKSLQELRSVRPGLGGAARVELRWVPWNIELRVVEGQVVRPDGGVAAITPYLIAQTSTDDLTIEVANATLRYRAALFFAQSLTLALIPDGDASLRLPSASAVLPADESVPKPADITLNTTLRLPESAIAHVANQLNKANARFTFPTGDPNVGSLTFSEPKWSRDHDLPLAEGVLATTGGRRFKAKVTLHNGLFSWLSLYEADLTAINRPCTGTVIERIACNAENGAASLAAPVAAAVFTDRYRLVPIRPLTTERAFPLTLGNRRMEFRGLLYSFTALARSADLIMHAQFAIGELP